MFQTKNLFPLFFHHVLASYSQPESNKVLERPRLSRRRMIWLLPPLHSLPPPQSKSSTGDSATHRKIEKERQLSERRGGRGGGRSQSIRRPEKPDPL
jgi:hypothetical protein